MTTTNLSLTEWANGQSQPEVSVNESLDILDSILGSTLTHEMTADADYTLATTGTPPYEWQYARIVITDTVVTLTGPVNIVVPAKQRQYTFTNQTAEVLTVKAATGTGIACETGRTVRVRYDGTNVISDETYLFKDVEFRAYTETLIAEPSATAGVALSCASSNAFNVTLIGNTSVTFTDVPSTSGGMFTSTVFVTQDGTGARSLNVVGAIYASGQASTPSQTPGARDLWVFTTTDFGSSWYAMAGGLKFV